MPALAEPIQIAPRDEQEMQQVSRLYRTLLHEPAAALISPGGEGVGTGQVAAQAWRRRIR